MQSYIFDIDGTLVDTKKNGKKAFIESFEILHKLKLNEDLFGLSFLGGVDYIIYRRLCNYLEIREDKIELFIELYASVLEDKYSPEKVRWSFPGSLIKLMDLLKNKSHLLSVGTGNFQKTADIKLKFAGILDYFSFIGGCHREETRTEIIGKTVQYSLLQKIAPQDIFYIGDAPADRSCAHELALSFIGIGSHFSGEAGKTREYKKEIFFPTLDHFYEFLVDSFNKQTTGNKKHELV